MTEENVRLSNGMARPAFRAKEHRCADCGEFHNNQGSHCVKCLNRKYYEEALAQQKLLFENPDLTVLVTNRRPPQVSHLVLVGHHGMGWCGELVAPGGSRNWLHVGPGDRFRRNTCQKCLEVFRKVTGRKAEVIKEVGI